MGIFTCHVPGIKRVNRKTIHCAIIHIQIYSSYHLCDINNKFSNIDMRFKKIVQDLVYIDMLKTSVYHKESKTMFVVSIQTFELT